MPILGGHRRGLRAALSAMAASLLVACGTVDHQAVPMPSPAQAGPTGSAAALPGADGHWPEGSAFQRAKSRWIAAGWQHLPGWESDQLDHLLPALQRQCVKPPLAAWQGFCRELLARWPAGTTTADPASTRQWLAQRLRPYQLLNQDGSSEGLMTGYFEPMVEARPQREAGYTVPLYALPPALPAGQKDHTRQDFDTLPAAQARLKGLALAWVADPLDALVLQIQGSGRLLMKRHATDEGQWMRLAYAGHNGHPYQSVGRWLIDRGELPASQASWPGIKAWAQANPKRVYEMLWANPRVVFFKLEPLPDPSAGPKGALGVPLTPMRSIAVDPGSVPYGTPVWLVSTVPGTWPSSATAPASVGMNTLSEPPPTQASPVTTHAFSAGAPLQRLVLAQDTGSAILGAVRADFFWGWGPYAEAMAGRTKQALRLWALWPAGQEPPP